MIRKFKNKTLPKGILIERGYVWIKINFDKKVYLKCMGPVSRLGVIDEAIAKLNDIRNQIRLNKFNSEEPVQRLSFEAAADVFLKLHALKKKAPQNFFCHMKPIKEFFAGRYIDTFTYIDIENYRAWRSKQMINGRPLKQSTINREHIVLTTMFYRLEEWKELNLIANIKLPRKNPCSLVKKVDERQFIRKRVLTPGEFKRFLDVDHPSLQRIARAAVNSTLRMKDLRLLSKDNINEAAHQFEGLQEKPGVPYIVPINEVMQELIDTAPGLKLFDFTNFRKLFEQARRESGLTHFEFKDLRRTGARTIYNDTGDIMLVKECLGHTDVATTQRYLGVSAKQIQRAGLALASKFSYNPDQNSRINSSKDLQEKEAKTDVSYSL